MSILSGPECKWIQAKELTLLELRNSKLPNESLYNINVDLGSSAKKLYRAIHAYRLGNDPFILLVSQDHLDKENFREVVGAVAEIVEGTPEKQIISREIDGGINLSQRISGIELPTQQLVAKFVEEYIKHFSVVTISAAYYHHISARALRNPGFPADKLSSSNDKKG